MPIGSPARTTARTRLREGRGQGTSSFSAATTCTIEPTALVTAIAIASATIPPLSMWMISTAAPHSTLLSVSTSIGTRLSTRSWNSRPSAPTPSNGIDTVRITPASSIAWLRCSRATVASEIRIIGASASRRRNITAPIHSCSCSG